MQIIKLYRPLIAMISVLFYQNMKWGLFIAAIIFAIACNYLLLKLFNMKENKKIKLENFFENLKNTIIAFKAEFTKILISSLLLSFLFFSEILFVKSTDIFYYSTILGFVILFLDMEESFRFWIKNYRINLDIKEMLENNESNEDDIELM